MRKDDSHVSDQELLEACDGELAPRDAARVQAHLAACWSCRGRRTEIERTISDFVKAHRSGWNQNLPSIEGPRAQLRARLRQLTVPLRPRPWLRLRQYVGNARGQVVALALAVIFLLGLVIPFGVQQVGASSVPDSRLTPGATRSVTRDDVCPARISDDFYPIPATLAYRVFEKYRIRNPLPRSYEVDYLITPALGGADDIRNLWPQPYASGKWNAHVKDALEDHLHDLVCDGRLDLKTAQNDISDNWIEAYQKYFKTDRPLERHIDFSIDPPWED